MFEKHLNVYDDGEQMYGVHAHAHARTHACARTHARTHTHTR